MPTEINAKLLGRIPSTPDERDYPLSLFLGNGTALDNALNSMNHSMLVPKVVKVWAKLATQAIESATPAPPAPTPTPTPPTPTGLILWDDADTVLDQGNYGTCVGNGWANYGNTLPIDDRFDEKDARAIYYEATILDGQPDDPDAPGGGQQGATLRSGAKAMKNRKRLGAYAFAENLSVMLEWLDTKGPVVVATDWLHAMFTPDANGLVIPGGPVDGGHCYAAVGHWVEEKRIVFQNSWGAEWGITVGNHAGRFTMTESDFQDLCFGGNGEVCTAVELAA